MATYEEYLSQITKDYEPTRQAIQNQINAIPGQQQVAVDDVNKQYGLQQQNLDRQKNEYNYSANNNANNRGLAWSNIGQNYASSYNRNSYAPAVTQLQTNQQKDINSTNETYKNRQFELENYLNSLINENSQYARSLAQADADREAQERSAARQAAAMRDYLNPGNNGSNSYSTGTNTQYNTGRDELGNYYVYNTNTGNMDYYGGVGGFDDWKNNMNQNWNGWRENWEGNNYKNWFGADYGGGGLRYN